MLWQRRHNSLGKTEMWYIMQADQDARIIVGFKRDSNADEYLENLKAKLYFLSWMSVNVKKEMHFFRNRTVHAIGAGLLVAEIQQTSDITYRLYDFDRVDAQGNTRDFM
jgi:mannose-6-phosphate isomerase